MRKQLIVLFTLLVLLSGCSMQGDGGNVSSTSNTTTSTSTMNESNDNSISSIWGMMDYLGNQGFNYSGVSEITDLNDGYKYGMSFNHDGGNYQLYQYDDTNDEMKTILENAKETNKVQMKVNGEYVEVPAYVHNGYILVYPEGINHSDIEKYFR